VTGSPLPSSRIAFLGPEGTFAEAAARMVGAADGAGLVPCLDVEEVLRTVERGDADRGVVPIESSTEGSVTATLDALAFGTDLLITAELELPLHLQLAAPAGTTLADVRAVHSHATALGSARRWLGEHLPAAERVTAASTARAAQEVGLLGVGHAALVNPLAAERYGLTVLADGVGDRTDLTRFVVLGRDLPGPTGWDRTTVIVFIDRNRPGALLQLLQILAERGIDLTKLESRPTRAELGEYCFLLDLEGHVADERVGDALAAVKRRHRDVRLLGSYRRSGARQRDEAERIQRDDAAYRDAAAWLAGWRERMIDPR
jgi:prephenate dehydratase